MCCSTYFCMMFGRKTTDNEKSIEQKFDVNGAENSIDKFEKINKKMEDSLAKYQELLSCDDLTSEEHQKLTARVTIFTKYNKKLANNLNKLK